MMLLGKNSSNVSHYSSALVILGVRLTYTGVRLYHSRKGSAVELADLNHDTNE